MINGILGIKLGQTHKFLGDGERIPVTIIQAGPCFVTQIKENALQIGLGERKKASRSIIGHIQKAKLAKAPQFLREIRLQDGEEIGRFKLGDEIRVEQVFEPGDLVHITGISKGKGFAGVVKRWGFAGGPRTHGQSDRERAPGSIGSTTTPGRVLKGKKMAGRMGATKVTVRNLRIFKIEPEKNLLMVKGLVPGSANGLLIIRKAGKTDSRFLEKMKELPQEIKEGV